MNNKKVFLITIIIFILDQAVKILLIDTYKKPIVIINNFFTLTLTKNTGAAFSILNNNMLFLIIISIIFLLVIIYYFYKNKIENKYKLLYSFILGGLIGNLYDRIFRNGVIDYLSFNIFGYYFPIFNIADIFITLSIITLIILELRDDINDSRRRKCKN